MSQENIIIRNKGYQDGYLGREAVHPDSEPYMDGYRLGALVLEGEQEGGGDE
jgi:hypothetical protein